MAYGGRGIRVEAEDGLRFLVPVEWTNLRPRPAPPERDGRSVRLTVGALLQISKWVGARVCALESQNSQEVEGPRDVGDNNLDGEGRAGSVESRVAVVGQVDPPGPGCGADGHERGGR